MTETVKWMTPMDSPRRIGLETTWKGVLIVVWGAALWRGKNRRELKVGNIFDDGTPTDRATVKWTIPADFPRRIGLETTWKGVLIVFWGAALWGWKNCREWKMGNDSDDGTPTNGDMVNWITPTDSPCRIGLETTSKGVLIVAWGAACGGEKIAVRYHANNYSDSRREDMVKPMPLRDSSHLIGPKTTLDEVLILDGSTLWRGNITAR